MQIALEESEKAYQKFEVPVGAVLVDSHGTIITRQHNAKEYTGDPCAHAEILALSEAGKMRKSWRLTDTYLYVTLEPCPMCLGAMIQARVKKLIFGAYDPKGGALSLNLNIHQNKKLNHQLEVMGGINQYQCGTLLSNFFKERRNHYS